MSQGSQIQPNNIEQYYKDTITSSSELKKETNYLLHMLISISNLKDEGQKMNIAKQMEQFIKQHDYNAILPNITPQLCDQLMKLIRGGIKTFQQSLLNVVWEIAKLGSELSQQNENNIFFSLFNDSRLFVKIWNIFYSEMSINKKRGNSDEYSKLLIITSQIYSVIIKNQQPRSKLSRIIAGIHDSNTRKLIQQFNQNQKHKIVNNEQIQNNEQQNEIQLQLERSLYSISSLSNSNQVMSILTYQMKLHEVILPLIHINFPPELKYSQNMEISETENQLNLKSAVFESLGSLINHQIDYSLCLQYNPQILEHICAYIIPFSTQYQIQRKQHVAQSFFEYNTHSIQIAVGSTYLLQFILCKNNSLCSQAEQIPNLVSSLFNLIKFNCFIHQNKKTEIQSTKIRLNSYIDLRYIQSYGSNKLKMKMGNEFNYLKALIEGIVIGGGIQELNDQIFKQILSNIHFIFENIFIQSKTLEQFNYNRRRILQDIEESGSNEEIEAHQFHQTKSNGVQMWAEGTKKIMNNIKKDLTNEQY